VVPGGASVERFVVGAERWRAGLGSWCRLEGVVGVVYFAAVLPSGYWDGMFAWMLVFGVFSLHVYAGGRASPIGQCGVFVPGVPR